MENSQLILPHRTFISDTRRVRPCIVEGKNFAIMNHLPAGTTYQHL